MRVIDVVTSEMEKYEPGEYTEGVLETVRVLRDQSNPILHRIPIYLNPSLVLPSFAERINMAVDALRMRSGQDDGRVSNILFKTAPFSSFLA